MKGPIFRLLGAGSFPQGRSQATLPLKGLNHHHFLLAIRMDEAYPEVHRWMAWPGGLLSRMGLVSSVGERSLSSIVRPTQPWKRKQFLRYRP